MPTLVSGQDQFGRGVAVGNAEVFVLKPNAGRGPAALFVFQSRGNGEWERSQRLLPPDVGQTGESFGGSLSAMPGLLVVGSADPSASWGAHVFRRDGSGEWAAEGGYPLRGGSTGGSAPTGAIDFATVLRILQPPARSVAARAGRGVVGVMSGANAGIYVMGPNGDGGWAVESRISAPDVRTNSQFGAALAVSGDRVFAAAPGQEGGGAVFVYRPAGDGWEREVVLTPDSAWGVRRFGAALLIADDRLLVGAPGTGGSPGMVVVYARDAASGEWAVADRIVGPDGAARGLFGAAMAASGAELWIAAPLAAERRGMVYRYRRDGDIWRSEGELTASASEPGDGFGLSVALGSDLAVVGAPGAVGGRGRAAVFRRTGDGWAQDAWLDAGTDLDPVIGAEVQCEEGRAAHFDCSNVDLLAFMPIDALGGDASEGVTDVWGWTDPETGREYALVGRTRGATFVDVTDPSNPVYVGIVPANPAGLRDLKVYQDHLFFVGDGAGNHGLVVFDLARLRRVAVPPVTFEPDAKYDSIGSAHNLIIDTEAGFAYPVGASGGGQTCGGGLHMVDIRDPLRPTFAGCYTDTEGLVSPGRTHDGQCVIYRGPDPDYQGRQICFASNETALRIVDVTEKANPIPLAAASYPGVAYVHQGWLTDDQRYFYLNDELDELVGLANRTRTLVWDLSELDDPVLVGEYLGPNRSTDHNLYVKGDRMYQANYQAGMRVIDITDRANPVEIGFFDTTPYEGDPPGFNGAWTAYPFFESGTVIVTSMNEGLFILRPRPQTLIP